MFLSTNFKIFKPRPSGNPPVIYSDFYFLSRYMPLYLNYSTREKKKKELRSMFRPCTSCVQQKVLQLGLFPFLSPWDAGFTAKAEWILWRCASGQVLSGVWLQRNKLYPRELMEQQLKSRSGQFCLVVQCCCSDTSSSRSPLTFIIAANVNNVLFEPIKEKTSHDPASQQFLISRKNMV